MLRLLMDVLVVATTVLYGYVVWKILEWCAPRFHRLLERFDAFLCLCLRIVVSLGIGALAGFVAALLGLISELHEPDFVYGACGFFLACMAVGGAIVCTISSLIFGIFRRKIAAVEGAIAS